MKHNVNTHRWGMNTPVGPAARRQSIRDLLTLTSVCACHLRNALKLKSVAGEAMGELL